MKPIPSVTKRPPSRWSSTVSFSKERPPQLLGALLGVARLLYEVSKSSDEKRFVVFSKMFLLLVHVTINFLKRPRK